MIRSIDCMCRWVAEDLKPESHMAMISIVDEKGYEEFSLPGWRLILPLRFRDIERQMDGYVCFDRDMAQQVTEFVEAIHNLDLGIDLRVHCEAGVARSAAIAYWVSKTYGVDLPDDFNLRTKPNKLVLKEMFSLSMDKDVDIVQRLRYLHNYDPDKPYRIGDPIDHYYEFDVVDTEASLRLR